MEELFYQCPYCFSEVSIIADLSVAEQEYIEDCERCCNPIGFRIIAQNQAIIDFQWQAIEQ